MQHIKRIELLLFIKYIGKLDQKSVKKYYSLAGIYFKL